MWDGWPSSGPVEPFGDAEGYHEAVDVLVGSEAIIDEAMVYFDVRLRWITRPSRSASPTCAPTSTTPSCVAAVTRALVETSASADEPVPPWRIEMLRAGRWLARRYGLTGSLLDPYTGKPCPAAEVVGLVLEEVDDALRAAGDQDFVHEVAERLLRDGGGAGRQRAAAGDDVDLDAVGQDLLDRTRAGLS